MSVAASNELEALLARRQSLALDVVNAVEGAADELDRIERQLMVAMREQELAALALTEAGRREAEAERKAGEAEHQLLVGEQARLGARRQELYREIEEATAALERPIREAKAIDADLWAVTSRLGQVPDRRNGSRIANFLQWRLGEAGLRPDFGAAFPYMWKPLTEAT